LACGAWGREQDPSEFTQQGLKFIEMGKHRMIAVPNFDKVSWAYIGNQ
jgi:hypothetical protein